jgi:hypothetical protein
MHSNIKARFWRSAASLRRTEYRIRTATNFWELANALNGAGKQSHLLGRLGCRTVTPKKCCAVRKKSVTHEKCDAIINVQSQRHNVWVQTGAAAPISWAMRMPMPIRVSNTRGSGNVSDFFRSPNSQKKKILMV